MHSLSHAPVYKEKKYMYRSKIGYMSNSLLFLSSSWMRRDPALYDAHTTPNNYNRGQSSVRMFRKDQLL